MRGLRRFPLLSTAVALLAALGFVLAAEAWEHTDDGCDVEIHCLPCRWHHGATVVFPLVPQPAAPADLGSAHVDAEPQTRLAGARSDAPSRAPPLA